MKHNDKTINNLMKDIIYNAAETASDAVFFVSECDETVAVVFTNNEQAKNNQWQSVRKDTIKTMINDDIKLYHAAFEATGECERILVVQHIFDHHYKSTNDINSTFTMISIINRSRRNYGEEAIDRNFYEEYRSENWINNAN